MVVIEKMIRLRFAIIDDGPPLSECQRELFRTLGEKSLYMVGMEGCTRMYDPVLVSDHVSLKSD